jgi:hypothetical protein
VKETTEHKTSVEDQPGATDDIVKGVSQVFVSALGVGAALTRLVAKSTARGTVEEVPHDTEPVAAMVHYGTVTLKNVVGIVASGAQFLKVQITPNGADSTATSSASTNPAPISKPRIHQGASLRVPLSIENPGDHPMGPIVFQTRDLQFLGDPESGTPLIGESVSFAPAELTIQPHDFEKLTVFIDVPTGAAPGAYRALIGSVTNNFHTTIEFDVAPA